MKATKQKTINITLQLNHEEAIWLMDYIKYSFVPSGEKEDGKTTDMKNRMFNVIKHALND